LADFRNTMRDPTILVVLILSALPIILFTWFRPIMDAAAFAAWEITSISNMIAPLVLLMPAYLIGWVTGFLILEERDDGPLLALDVTPIGKSGVAIYRATIAFILSAAIALISMLMMFDEASWVMIFILSAFTAMQASIVNFALPAIARNKVQGLAMTKGINIFIMAALLAFIPSDWRFLAAPIPSFWIGELTKLLSETTFSSSPSFWLLVIFSALIHIMVLMLIYRVFSSRNE